MPRILPIDLTTAPAATTALLDGTRKLLGSTPNMFTTAAHSPATARLAWLEEGEIVEGPAHVALNVFTNDLNNVAATDVDFPLVEIHGVAA